MIYLIYMQSTSIKDYVIYNLKKKLAYKGSSAMLEILIVKKFDQASHSTSIYNFILY